MKTLCCLLQAWGYCYISVLLAVVGLVSPFKGFFCLLCQSEHLCSDVYSVLVACQKYALDIGNVTWILVRWVRCYEESGKMSGNFTVCGEWSPCDKWCGNDNVDGAELMLIDCCCLTLSKFFFILHFALHLFVLRIITVNMQCLACCVSVIRITS